jgi:protein TonB
MRCLSAAGDYYGAVKVRVTESLLITARPRPDVAADEVGGRDLGNVIPLFPRALSYASGPAPELRLSSADRPAPPARVERNWWYAALLTGSIAVHAAAVIVLNDEPPPLASVGIQSISVEIVLGSDTAAGLANKPTAVETPLDAASVSETADLVEPDAAREVRESAESATSVEPRTIEAAPPTVLAEIQAEPQSALAAKVATAVPERKVAPPARPKPQHRNSEQGNRVAARQPPASTAAASNGAGPGRSDLDTNYRGIVAAQLARNKNFPLEARRNGEQGNAVVSFSIDGNGHVTQVALVRATGIASLDHEAQSMVRRASPFPPPPSRRPMRFTVPVSFNIR